MLAGSDRPGPAVSATLPQLIETLDDDIVPIELPYHSPTADAVYAAFDFAKKGNLGPEHRTLNSPGFFADRTDPHDVDAFDWPDPARHIAPDECRRLAGEASDKRIHLGVIWTWLSCHVLLIIRFGFNCLPWLIILATS